MITTQQAYVTLGIPFGSDEQTVRSAYRRLIRAWHPDRNDSPEAHSKSQALNIAYQHLERIGFTPETADHDQTFHYYDDEPPPYEYSGFYGYEERFRKAANIKRKMKITLEEAAFGCVFQFKGKTSDICTACHGGGDTGARTCSTCAGRGYLFSRRFYPQTCPDCYGNGTVTIACDKCAGTGRIKGQPYAFSVNIPPGVRNGETLYARRVGGYASDGVTRADAEITVAIPEHDIFYFDDKSRLTVDVPVSVLELMRGDSIEVPTLYGLHKLQLKPNQYDYFLDELGFPDRRGVPGPLHVDVTPLLSDARAPELADLIRRLEAILGAKGDPAYAKIRKTRAILTSYSPHTEKKK